MDKYTSPQAASVIQIHQMLLNWFQKHPDEWKQDVDRDIQTQSGGKIRAFQTFFDSPSEALSGGFKIQALAEKDMLTMYPTHYEQSLSLDDHSYLYIFNCNDGAGQGNALRAAVVVRA